MFAEPLTTLTDYAIALECLVFATLLLRSKQAEWFWAGAFASVSVAALLGGTYHALGRALTARSLIGLWQGMLLALAIASFLTVIAESQRVSWQSRWGLFMVATAKLVILRVLAASPWIFVWAVLDYLVSLGMAGWLQWRSDRLQKGLKDSSLDDHPPCAIWMLAGIITSGVAALCLLLPWPVLFQLSPLVLYHGVQMVALYCIFRSVSAAPGVIK